MEKSKTFCPLPFVNLYAQPSGYTKPCCIGETIYTQALEEKNKLEEQIQLTFELPVNYMIG